MFIESLICSRHLYGCLEIDNKQRNNKLKSIYYIKGKIYDKNRAEKRGGWANFNFTMISMNFET